jgi:alpha-1,4-digalacturonate transport system permease protein
MSVQSRKYRLWALFFVAPNMVLFLLFFVFPASLGLYYSLTNYNGFTRMDFVGLQNYVSLVRDPLFYSSVFRTISYVAISVFLVYVSSLLVAVLLTKKTLFLRSLNRVLVYLPTLFSTVLVGLTWRWIFGEKFGIINYILGIMNLQPVPWATEAFWAFATVIISSVWFWTGFYMLIFIGGIENIDVSLYEAAHIDGANGRQQFLHITIPQLRHISFMVLILYTIEAFKVFAQVITLTGGGPGNATTFVIQYIYQSGFERLRVGYASAASMIVFSMLFLFSMFRYYLNRKQEKY